MINAVEIAHTWGQLKVQVSRKDWPMMSWREWITFSATEKGRRTKMLTYGGQVSRLYHRVKI